MKESTMTQDTQSSEISGLLERRSLLQDWLDRLNDQAGSVSDRVMRRVREDYESRLQQVLDELTSHKQGLQAELEAVTARLAQAEVELAEAVDRLEEGRLRHTIGEITNDEWGQQSRRLEEDVRAGEERHRAAGDGAERLRELLDQIDERTVEAPPPPQAEVTYESHHAAATTSFTLDDVVEAAVDDEIEEDRVVPFDAGDDAFLDRIDRALVNRTAAAVRPEEEEVEEVVDTSPKPGLKCAECGYTNDLSAWFCGVCGADVG